MTNFVFCDNGFRPEGAPWIAAGIVEVDDVHGLCAACGALRPLAAIELSAQVGRVACQNCGGLQVDRRDHSEAALLMAAADPQRLRSQRRALVAWADRNNLVRVSRRYEGREMAFAMRVRRAFLASAGAVPASAELYALWLDTWLAADPRRKAELIIFGIDHAYVRPGTSSVEVQRSWMPTLPVSDSELPALFDHEAFDLLIPPVLSADWSADALKGQGLGGSRVFVLQQRKKLEAFTNVSSVLTYPNVEWLRRDREAMARIRSRWLRADTGARLWGLLDTPVTVSGVQAVTFGELIGGQVVSSFGRKRGTGAAR